MNNLNKGVKVKEVIYHYLEDYAMDQDKGEWGNFALDSLNLFNLALNW